MVKKDLKPCPFCGGRAEMVICGTGDSTAVYMPRCCVPDCCARVGRKWPDLDTAVYAWNRRKGNG